MTKLFFLAGILSVFSVFFSQLPPVQVTDFIPHISSNALNQTSHYQSQMVTQGKTASVHSAAMSELSNLDIRAFWYGGTREGAKDVAIYSTIFDNDTKQWEKAEAIIDRHDVAASTHRYIRKLGNPVVVKKLDGSLWLFYVSVSVGGWSTSQLNVSISFDEGLHWTPPKHLITSPFFNLSYLVKSPPILLANGNIGLPVYHELAGKFSEWIEINSDQQVIMKHRISAKRYAIQPTLTPVTNNQAISFMRDSDEVEKRVFMSTSQDQGQHWSPPEATTLKNPNSAVATLPISEHELLMVLNNSEHERDNLSLAYSSDLGKSWRILAILDQPSETDKLREKIEYSYPYLIKTKTGSFHLLYTWHKTHIKHIEFNQTWLQQKISTPLTPSSI
ncbi:MAG: exo-alpha-sialidase [Methylococcales bacterium]|jgi:predicted neuraminidase|nr:exo-alpha-sialidase [Methylococcales bacterium]